MSQQQPQPIFSKMSLFYLVIYLIAVLYNAYKGNMIFAYLWSALFLGNLGYLIYVSIKRRK